MSIESYAKYDFSYIKELSEAQLRYLRTFFARKTTGDPTTWVEPVKQIESIGIYQGISTAPIQSEMTSAKVRIPLQEKCIARFFNFTKEQIKLIDELRSLNHEYQQFLRIIPGYAHDWKSVRNALIKKGILELEKDPYVLLEDLTVKQLKEFLVTKALSKKGRRKIEFIERIIENVSGDEIFEFYLSIRNEPLTKVKPPYDMIMNSIYGGDFKLAETIYHTESHRYAIKSRYQDYKQREQRDWRFKWFDVNDARTCPVCKLIEQKIDEEGQGKGVSLDRLFTIMRKVAKEQLGYSLEWSPHFLCRCNFNRVVDI